MNVTINTDASFSPQHNVGAYAFWITCNAGRYKHSGTFKDNVKSSHVAEVMCIVNAFYYLSKLNLKDVKRIIVNTDSLNAVYIFTNNKEGVNKYSLHWGEPFKQKVLDIRNAAGFTRKNGITVEFWHVKAHNGTDTKRQWVNDWCDTQAKNAMRSEVAKIKKG